MRKHFFQRLLVPDSLLDCEVVLLAEDESSGEESSLLTPWIQTSVHQSKPNFIFGRAHPKDTRKCQRSFGKAQIQDLRKFTIIKFKQQLTIEDNDEKS